MSALPKLTVERDAVVLSVRLQRRALSIGVRGLRVALRGLTLEAATTRLTKALSEVER